MAEYIDRALALREVERWQKGITVNIKAELKALHAEDVVERSKIDKAIEEIEDLNLSWVASHYEDRFYGFQQEVLEILKRNIGE